MANELPELTPAEKVAKMKAAGYVPEQVAPAPSDLTPAQKIAKMQAAGYVPEGQQPSGGSIMDSNVNFLNKIPVVGEYMGDDVSPNDMIHGAINDLPMAGKLIGGAAGYAIGRVGGARFAAGTGALGAGLGGEAGSYAEDGLNALIYGKQTSIVEAHQKAISEQEDGVSSALIGEGTVGVLSQTGKAVLATKVGSKLGQMISDIPAPVIKAYADGAERIKALYKQAGEAGENTEAFRMAEAAKTKYLTDIKDTRTALNNQISSGVKDSTELISSEPIIAKLQEGAARLNPDITDHAPQIAKINSFIEDVKKVAGDDGKLSLSEANQLKMTFQDYADQVGAYGKPGGADIAQQAGFAAKGAGAVTRETMNAVAPKAVVKANNTLSTMHKIEDGMENALLNPRSNANKVIQAGEGRSQVGKKGLADLQDMQAQTGTDMVGPAKDVAAANSFGAYHPGPSMKGIGQPIIKGAIDAATAVPGSGLGNTLGQSVMHGMGAQDALQKP